MTVRLARLFLQFTRDLPASDFNALLACDEKPVYLFHTRSNSATVPASTEIAWQVRLLLTMFHRKHVFCMTPKSSLSHVPLALWNWEHKLRWNCFFGSSAVDPTAGESWWRLRSKKRYCKPCGTILPLSLQCMVDVVRREVWHARLVQSRRRAPPVPAVIWLALSLLQKTGIGAPPTDKDAGFLFSSQERFARSLHASIVWPR